MNHGLVHPTCFCAPCIARQWFMSGRICLDNLWKPAILQVTGSSKHEDSPVSWNWLEIYYFVLNWMS